MKEILVVEDDINIQNLIVYALKNQGFKTKACDNSDDFYKILKTSRPDLIILDVMIAGDDGFTLLEKLRSSGKYKYLPIIMLTAKTSEYHKIKGLDMGADDYISKPFSVLEMISRINAVLRRYDLVKEGLNEEIIILDGLEMNLSKRIVKSDEEELDLTFKEFELLKYLLENQDLVLSRGMIMEEVWGFDFQGDSRTIDVHIRSLRQKLKRNSQLIKTVRNVGYKIGG